MTAAFALRTLSITRIRGRGLEQLQPTPLRVSYFGFRREKHKNPLQPISHHVPSDRRPLIRELQPPTSRSSGLDSHPRGGATVAPSRVGSDAILVRYAPSRRLHPFFCNQRSGSRVREELPAAGLSSSLRPDLRPVRPDSRGPFSEAARRHTRERRAGAGPTARCRRDRRGPPRGRCAGCPWPLLGRCAGLPCQPRGRCAGRVLRWAPVACGAGAEPASRGRRAASARALRRPPVPAARALRRAGSAPASRGRRVGAALAGLQWLPCWPASAGRRELGVDC